MFDLATDGSADLTALAAATDAGRFTGAKVLSTMSATAGRTELVVNDLEAGMAKAVAGTRDRRLAAQGELVAAAVAAHRRPRCAGVGDDRRGPAVVRVAVPVGRGRGPVTVPGRRAMER